MANLGLQITYYWGQRAHAHTHAHAHAHTHAHAYAYLYSLAPLITQRATPALSSLHCDFSFASIPSFPNLDSRRIVFI